MQETGTRIIGQRTGFCHLVEATGEGVSPRIPAAAGSGEMKLIFLPLTAQRSLIFCEKQTTPLVRSKPKLDDRVASKAGKIWSNFEASDKKWKQKIVKWTGKLLDSVPFEENGLRTVPPMNTYMRKLKSSNSHISEQQAIQEDVTHNLEPFELLYPHSASGFNSFDAASQKLKSFVDHAKQTHVRQALWCFAGLPLTLPFAINPFIPNFPGIYLGYRIWCNWRGYKAAKHIEYLLEHRHFSPSSSGELDKLYASQKLTDSVSSEFVTKLHGIFQNEKLYKELLQAVRQTHNKKSSHGSAS